MFYLLNCWFFLFIYLDDHPPTFVTLKVRRGAKCLIYSFCVFICSFFQLLSPLRNIFLFISAPTHPHLSRWRSDKVPKAGHRSSKAASIWHLIRYATCFAIFFILAFFKCSWRLDTLHYCNICLFFLKETEDFGDWTHCQGRISAIFLSKQTKVVGCMTDVAPSQDLDMQVVLLVHRKIKYRILWNVDIFKAGEGAREKPTTRSEPI